MEKSLALLYGKDKSGKSFLAIGWALCIAAGIAWLGRKVKRGHVVYVVAEGADGAYARVTAWRKRNGVEEKDCQIRFVDHSLNIRSPRQSGPGLRRQERVYGPLLNSVGYAQP